MKTITNCEARPRKRRLLLSLLCAGVVATFLGGCAEGPYVTAYDTGYYYPTAYYTPDYDDYYGPTYSRTIVRSASVTQTVTARVITAATGISLRRAL